MSDGALAVTPARDIALLPVLGLAVALTVLYVAVIAVFGPSAAAMASLPALAIVLVLFANLEFALVVVVATLFVDHPVSWFSLSVWTSFLLLPALLWRFRSTPVPGFSPELRRAVIWYGVSVLPSLFVSEALFASVYRLLNVAAFLVVLATTAACVRSPRQFLMVAGAFIAGTLLNSVDVIMDAQILQQRSFGFSGIMYVDYAALGVCLAAAMAMLTSGRRRWWLVLAAMLMALGSVLSQTRNTWLSAVVALTFLAIYLWRFSDRVGVARRQVALATTGGGVAIVLIAAAAIAMNPGVEERSMQLTQTDGAAPAITQSGGVSSSLVSRALIWSTAINAFAAHPVAGIGVYAFPFLSRQYASMPTVLYRRFVEQLTPHQTHLAVLAETGIVGFAGFIFFIMSAFRLALRAVRSSVDTERRRMALVILVGLVYVGTSMVFTDAWLWGPLIIVFGLLLGMAVANERDASARAVVPRTEPA